MKFSNIQFIKRQISFAKNGFTRLLVQSRAKCPLFRPALIPSKSAVIKVPLLNKGGHFVDLQMIIAGKTKIRGLVRSIFFGLEFA